MHFSNIKFVFCTTLWVFSSKLLSIDSVEIQTVFIDLWIAIRGLLSFIRSPCLLFLARSMIRSLFEWGCLPEASFSQWSRFIHSDRSICWGSKDGLESSHLNIFLDNPEDLVELIFWWCKSFLARILFSFWRWLHWT